MFHKNITYLGTETLCMKNTKPAENVLQQQKTSSKCIKQFDTGYRSAARLTAETIDPN